MPININVFIKKILILQILLINTNPTAPSNPTFEPIPYEMGVVPYNIEQPVVVPVG